MDDIILTIKETNLFANISVEDIEKMLVCLASRQVIYKKNEIILWENSVVTEIGIVLSGQGRSFVTDVSGKTTIISILEKGSFIGVLLAASRERKSPVSVQASDILSVLFLPFDNIIKPCVNGCERHVALLRNCFDSIAEKSLVLHDRIDCLIRPTVREKIIAYLTRAAKSSNRDTFMIPLDRRAMAEYINVDRSALSRELSRMKNDGLIDYYKNSFKLNNLKL